MKEINLKITRKRILSGEEWINAEAKDEDDNILFGCTGPSDRQFFHELAVLLRYQWYVNVTTDELDQ